MRELRRVSILSIALFPANNNGKMSDQTPSFEEWVHYCFTLTLGEFQQLSSRPTETCDQRNARLRGINPAISTEYLTRLFESPAIVMKGYFDKQIQHGIKFIFSRDSELMCEVTTRQVPVAAQVRCYRALSTLYTDFFEKVCTSKTQYRNADPRQSDDIDGLVFMIWDLDCVELPLVFPSRYPHLVDPCVEVLSTVLDRCYSRACILSALHGIGHACVRHYGDPEHHHIAARLQSAIDRLLDSRNLPKWMVEYAHQAKAGHVL